LLFFYEYYTQKIQRSWGKKKKKNTWSTQRERLAIETKKKKKKATLFFFDSLFSLRPVDYSNPVNHDITVDAIRFFFSP
jgi:hypothetical protein